MSLLSSYYDLVFPAAPYITWLSYGEKTDQRLKINRTTDKGNYVSRREFSMTLDGDIYIRYLALPDGESLEASTSYFQTLLHDKRPIKIDIGAIYSNSPKFKSSRHPQYQSKGASVIPREKEICFDIDMTDYDPVRRCCSGADICIKCWPLMKIACKVLSHQLKKAFGYTNLLFVYSGRRGVHCWVCDPKARSCPAVARSALAEYLNIIAGSSGPGDNGAAEKKRVKKLAMGHTLRGFSYIVDSSLKIIDQYWEDYIDDQGYMADTNYLLLTGLIYNAEIRSRINEKLASTSVEKRLQRLTEMLLKEKNGRGLLAEIKLQFCYPRLDINVSKDLHHLLKSPFSIHPKTNRVCVPIADFDNFDPFIVPDVSQLISELNKSTEKSLVGWKRTSLKPYVDQFNTFISTCLDSEDTHYKNLVEQSGYTASISPKKQKLTDKENIPITA